MRKFASPMLVALLVGMASLGCAKKPDATPSDNKPGGTATPTSNPSTDSDLERFQGVWAVESIEEPGDGKKGSPDFEKMKNETIKGMRFQFKGNKMSTIMKLPEGEHWLNYTFKLDEKANPKGINVTDLDDKGEPKKRLGKDGKPTSETKIDEGIYKLDGDLLVIAQSSPAGKDATRPTEFKARDVKMKAGTREPEVYGITVLRLKKTNEPLKEPPAKKNPVAIPPTGKPATSK